MATPHMFLNRFTTQRLFLTLAGPALLAGALACGCSREASRSLGGAATLDDVNRALAVWIMREGRPPGDLFLLTNSPVLAGRSLPEPPPGQKLVYDPKTQRAVFR